ncbi:MAG: GAF domain-containing protein [Pseudanabaena sp.]
MDSTLLDQIRHLCRDRAAYERLKAILVQQERVRQLSWQERYEKLLSDQVEETQTVNTFSNIIAREKSLAQLADAIQLSPSLDLVLQVAVQVAQKILQVDRVAIFCRCADGHSEFATDAIAAGIISIADMPERQLLLAKHMVDSMQSEQSLQIVDSIRSSSFSSHIVTLLEQIGISSYAANKIYAGHAAWGTLVAFHGSVYHSWSESDLTSLSLVAAQIGIAISLADMRRQSQVLADDLQVLQAELNSLQQTVNEIIESKAKIETSEGSTNLLLDDDQSIITIPHQNIYKDIYKEKTNEGKEQEFTALDVDSDSVADQQKDAEVNVFQEIEDNLHDEAMDSDYASISQNGVPRLFLISNSGESSDQVNECLCTEEDLTFDMDEKSDEDKAIVNPNNSEEEIIAIAENLLKAQDTVEEIITDAENLAEALDKDRDAAHIKISSTALQSGSFLEIESSEMENDKIISNDISADASKDEVEAPKSLKIIEVEITASLESNFPKYVEGSQSIQGLGNTETEPAELEEESQVSETTDIAEEITTTNEESVATESDNLDNYPQQEIALRSSELETIIIVPPFMEVTEREIRFPESSHKHERTTILSAIPPSSDVLSHENADLQLDTNLQLFIESTDATHPDDLQTEIEELDHDIYDKDRDPAIETQFIETILSIAGHDEKGIQFLLDVIDSYLKEAPRLVQAINKSLSSSDHTRLLQSLNTLRSSSEYIGALALAYQCRQLESAVSANYVVLIYACLSQVAIEAQRATEALRIERSRYAE